MGSMGSEYGQWVRAVSMGSEYGQQMWPWATSGLGVTRLCHCTPYASWSAQRACAGLGRVQRPCAGWIVWRACAGLEHAERTRRLMVWTAGSVGWRPACQGEIVSERGWQVHLQGPLCPPNQEAVAAHSPSCLHAVHLPHRPMYASAPASQWPAAPGAHAAPAAGQSCSLPSFFALLAHLVQHSVQRAGSLLCPSPIGLAHPRSSEVHTMLAPSNTATVPSLARRQPPLPFPERAHTPAPLFKRARYRGLARRWCSAALRSCAWWACCWSCCSRHCPSAAAPNARSCHLRCARAFGTSATCRCTSRRT